MHDLNNKLIWLMAIRVLVIASVLLPNLLFSTSGEGSQIMHMAESFLETAFDVDPTDSEERPRPAREPRNRVYQLLIAVVSLQTLLYAALSRPLKNEPVTHAYVQLFGDLFLITLLIYKFGRPTANLSILYFVVIGVACFLARRRAGLILATAAAVAYSSVVLLHGSPWFHELWAQGGPFAPSGPISNITGLPQSLGWSERIASWLEPPSIEAISGVPVSYNLSVHLVGFYSVALFAAYLARDPVLERKLEQRSLDLAYLKVLYRDVIQSISSGLAVTDLDGVITSLNQSGERILAVEERDLVGVHISDAGLFDAEAWKRSTDEAGRGMVRGELDLGHRAKPIYLGFSITWLRDGSGTHRGYILIFQDLSAWRRLQEQVRIQDRMAAIGQMAAGLAHEVGNPLAAISGSVQMLARNAESPAQAKLFEITLKESRRLDRTVKSFLQFARPRGPNLETFDIAAMLAEDVQLLRNSDEVLPAHEIHLDVEPHAVRADRDQLGQLFWNLARNALQAMPAGGRLDIEGRVVKDRYQLLFRDTGRGMTEEERANLFQPFKSFFGTGTGLGMAIVYRIVEEHEGNIEVDSEPGAGSTIVVDIPIRPGAEPEPEAAHSRGELRV